MDRPSSDGGDLDARVITVVPACDERAEPLRAGMAQLLNGSIGFGRQRAGEYLYAIILR
jgi:hypothetical protein